MKIRIGNDIRINLTIRGPLDYTFTNVKQIKCLLINECMTVGCDCCDGGKCPIEHRFPHEPFPQYYTPTPYTLNVCGHPRYHTDPWNCKACYHGFGGHFDDYHWWPGYHGFGLHPRKFIGDCCRFHMNHAMDIFYCDPRPCPHHHHCEPHHHCDCGMDKDFIYSAKATLMSGANKVQCIFPAYDQIMCGSYKLVLVVTTYEQGWGCRNLHTETIDYGTLFELVDDESGQLGSITIDADNIIHDDSTLSGLSIASKSESPAYQFMSGTTVEMGTSDMNGNIWLIIATTKDGRQVPYSQDWDFDELTFISSNSDILSIDKNGKMTIGTPDEDTTVTVTIIDNKNQSIRTSFDILVKASEETEGDYKLWMQYQIYGEDTWSNVESGPQIHITVPHDTIEVDFKLVRLTKNGNEVSLPYTVTLYLPGILPLPVVIDDPHSWLMFNGASTVDGDTTCTFKYTNGTKSAQIEYIITKEPAPIVDDILFTKMHVHPIAGVDLYPSIPSVHTFSIDEDAVQVTVAATSSSGGFITPASDQFIVYEVTNPDENPYENPDIVINTPRVLNTEVITDTAYTKEVTLEIELNKTSGLHKLVVLPADNKYYEQTDVENRFNYMVDGNGGSVITSNILSVNGDKYYTSPTRYNVNSEDYFKIAWHGATRSGGTSTSDVYVKAVITDEHGYEDAIVEGVLPLVNGEPDGYEITTISADNGWWDEHTDNVVTLTVTSYSNYSGGPGEEVPSGETFVNTFTFYKQ